MSLLALSVKLSHSQSRDFALALVQDGTHFHYEYSLFRDLSFSGAVGGGGVSCNTSFHNYKAKVVPLVSVEKHCMTFQVPVANETAIRIEFDKVV